MEPIIQPEDLLELVKTTDVVIVDAGSSISYGTQHLKGAVYADLNLDLAAVPEDAAKGGRHPLPDPAYFGQVLSRLGITPQSHVVVYDDKNGALAAARFWWMLRAAGHEKVQVLNGGLTAAVKAGFPLSDLVEMPIPVAEYTFADWNLPQAYMDEVETAALGTEHVVIDVREAARYRGETEPIDLIAGHIPGAINLPYAGNLDENGLFIKPEIIGQKYVDELKGVNAANSIIHCGSGVTACHTILAMNYAGLPMPKLYVGSWSEWSRNDKNIASGS
ncbi:sulfurtransferase [Flavobacterium psychrophilum]|nr:sulfurtransferase [Flavobacterium psychrophilum]AOE52879.1 sulfurtransferase [Flavobacterium psychrophilum]